MASLLSNDSKIIHFFNYLDYELIEQLNLSFSSPIRRNINPHFFAVLTKPIYFYLPKSTISTVYKNEYNEYIADYIIDLEEHIELLQFLDNLDTLCINKTIFNITNWFNKKIDTNNLIKSHNNIYYNDETNEKITTNLYVDKKNVDKIKKYNLDNDYNLLIKIDSIEFIKNKFKLRLELEEIIEGFDTYNDIESEDINFSEIIENKILEKNSEKKSEIINEELINELAIDDSEINNDLHLQNEFETDKKLEIDKKEIQDIINKKKIEKRNLIINTEKARRGIETYRDKIEDLDSEIETLNLRIKSNS